MENQFIEDLISKINWWKVAFIALVAALVFGLGFHIGKKSVRIPTDNPPTYTPQDTIKIEVPKPYPVSVKEPADTANIIADCVASGKYWELFPEKVRDSLIYIPTSQDTLDILADWATERTYKEKIYDVDTVGTATINAKVQYNRLTVIGAEIVPVVETVPYTVQPRKLSPFIGAGLNTSSTVMATAGAFVYDKWGAMLIYEHKFDTKDNILGGAVLYKF